MSEEQPSQEGGAAALRSHATAMTHKPQPRSRQVLGRWKSAERWLWGLCGGLIVAVAWLFCASGWGVPVTAQGTGPGGWIFYGGWALGVIACLGCSLRQARLGMGLMVALGWIGASLGNTLQASPEMRWHPVVLGMNVGLLILGLASAGIVVVYARSLQRRAQG